MKSSQIWPARRAAQNVRRADAPVNQAGASRNAAARRALPHSSFFTTDRAKEEGARSLLLVRYSKSTDETKRLDDVCEVEGFGAYRRLTSAQQQVDGASAAANAVLQRKSQKSDGPRSANGISIVCRKKAVREPSAPERSGIVLAG